MNNPPQETQTNAYRLPPLPSSLPPLTRYTREPKVEEQANEILTGTRTQALHRLKIVERNHPDSLLEETLISLCRLYNRCGYISEFIEAAMQTLFARAAKTATNQAQKWRQMSDCEKDDYADDVGVALMEWITNLDSGAEFWEVKYARCLRHLYIDTSRSYERFTKNEEEAISAFDNDEDSEVDRIERTEDFTLPDIDAALNWEFALKLLDLEERQVVSLLARQCTQEQIARHINKTTRSVRNRIKSIREKLEQWDTHHLG